jgi:hypothetical protein
VSGVSLTRATDGTHGSSGNATKEFIAGSLIWYKDDNAGNALGGATFQVCRTADRFATPINPPTCVTVADDTDLVVGPGLDQDPNPGVFKLTNLALGAYSVHETVAPDGWAVDPSTKTASLTLALPNATISVHFVDQRPIVKITGFGYTNAPVGTPTSGVLHGTAIFTATLHNYGNAAATLSGSLAVTTSGATPLVCTPTSPIALSGTLAADDHAAGGNDDKSFTISCEYNELDTNTVTGTLSVSYTINGLTRVASGSPATITFTIQGD